MNCILPFVPYQPDHQTDPINLGVCRPDAGPKNFRYNRGRDDTTRWLMLADDGTLWGNGKHDDDKVGGFDQGDCMGILLDLDDGSLRFFKNGVQHGPGYPAGSVTGPVALGVQMGAAGGQARLLPGAEWPTGHAP